MNRTKQLRTISGTLPRVNWAARIAVLDQSIASWMSRHGLGLMRWSLGIVFIWFGILKPLGVSPAADLVARTVYWGVDPNWFIPVLGIWEVGIGVCVIVRNPMVTRAGIFLMLLQMLGTFLPMILLPDVGFVQFPLELTLEGQYIVKNLVLISAALVIGSTRTDTMIQSVP